MTALAHSLRSRADNEHATCEDFLKIFTDDMNDLYQLSFLLTGNHEKAETCFVSGMEDCAVQNKRF